MVRATLIDSKDEAIHKQINVLISSAPQDEEDADRIRAIRGLSFLELFEKIRGIDVEFPRDPSPMRDVDFD